MLRTVKSIYDVISCLFQVNVYSVINTDHEDMIVSCLIWGLLANVASNVKRI